jgi:nucleoid-associated protein YgaU
MDGSPFLALSLTILMGSMPAWSKSKPPEIIYPTTHDQQSLEDLFRQPSAPADQPSQPVPAPAPMKPLPPPLVVPPPPVGEGTEEKIPSRPLSRREREPVAPATGGEATAYKVWIWQENGDTLWRIAQKVYGDKDKWPLIYQANKDVIKDPNKIYPKQVLKIPPIDWQP